ncbi:MAG: peptidoglycan editing factor PgeF [Gammaproteobacteria bacterium]|nr:peptidoglycan editing factor PgeF [Gammaproteobacteria bacterium]
MNEIPDDWPLAPWSVPGVLCGTTTRRGGRSGPPWQGFNTALHTGDDPDAVAANRARLAERIGARSLQFLDQIHGVQVHHLRSFAAEVPQADAVWTEVPGVALVIQTADCVPVMVTSLSGSIIGAAHAGWRGVASGVVPALLDAIPVDSTELCAWIGPAISGRVYEVGDDVRMEMARTIPAAVVAGAFVAGRSQGKWWLDLARIVRCQLESAGVGRAMITDSGLCTWSDPERFYSFRRDGQTGRLASFIVLKTS